MATHSSVLAWRISGMGEPGGCRLWGHTESDTTEVTQHSIAYQIMGFLCGSAGKESAYNAGDLGSNPGWEDPLEKEMATHSRTLAWKIPWTEEWNRLKSMESQRVGYDCATNFHFHFSYQIMVHHFEVPYKVQMMYKYELILLPKMKRSHFIAMSQGCLWSSREDS